MPFQSEKQRRYLWANEPEIARDWSDTYGSRINKDDGGIARIGLKWGGDPLSWLLRILLNKEDDDDPNWFQTQAQNITGGIGNIRDRLRTVHGTVQPQSYWRPESRLQRQNKARTSWMLNRALSGKDYSEKNLENLGGITVSPITTGGGSLRSGPDVTISHGGRDYDAYSNTPAGYTRAAETEGTFAEGGISQLVKSGPGRSGYGGPQDWGEEESGTGAYSPPSRDTGGDGDHIRRKTTFTPKVKPDPDPDFKPSHLGLGKLIQRRPKPPTYAEQIYNKLHPFFIDTKIMGKSPKGLYSPVNLTQHGTRPQNLASIYSKGFRGSKVPTWAGTGKTFTSNLDVAGRYGKQIPVVSSKFNLTSPIGGGFNKAGISFGPEVVQSPAQATKGMNLASKLGTQYTGPTAQRIMGSGISSLAGPLLSKIAGGVNVASLPIGYAEIAKGLQNRLESQGMPTGALSEDILGRGAMGAGADVLSVPDRFGSSQDVPDIPTGEINPFDDWLAGTVAGGDTRGYAGGGLAWPR